MDGSLVKGSPDGFLVEGSTAPDGSMIEGSLDGSLWVEGPPEESVSEESSLSDDNEDASRAGTVTALGFRGYRHPSFESLIQ